MAWHLTQLRALGRSRRFPAPLLHRSEHDVCMPSSGSTGQGLSGCCRQSDCKRARTTKGERCTSGEGTPIIYILTPSDGCNRRVRHLRDVLSPFAVNALVARRSDVKAIRVAATHGQQPRPAVATVQLHRSFPLSFLFPRPLFGFPADAFGDRRAPTWSLRVLYGYIRGAARRNHTSTLDSEAFRRAHAWRCPL